MPEKTPLQGALDAFQAPKDEFATWEDRMSDVFLAIANAIEEQHGSLHPGVVWLRIHAVTGGEDA